MKVFIPIFFLFIIAGCTSSGIVQTGPDSYMAREHSTLFSIDPGGGGAIANAITLATKHCATMGKYLIVGNTQTTPIGAGAQAIVNFECVNKNDRDYVRPKLQKAPDTSIVIKQ
jgi:hypothetical protein